MHYSASIVRGELNDFADAVRRVRTVGHTQIVAHLSDGDYVAYVDMGRESASVKLHITLREENPAIGTWWTAQAVRVRAHAEELPQTVSTAMKDAIQQVRERFARLIGERYEKRESGQSGLVERP